MKTYYDSMIDELQNGDILLEKSNTFLGNMVGNCIWKLGDTPLKWYMPHKPKRPSNHNAIFGYNKYDKPVIFEMLANGLVETPIENYVKLVETKTSELKFARLKNITYEEQHLLISWCARKKGSKYDFISYITFLGKIFLYSKLNIQTEKRYYCTEMVKHAYEFINKDFLIDNDFPVSLDVEKKINNNELNIVLELYNV